MMKMALYSVVFLLQTQSPSTVDEKNHINSSGVTFYNIFGHLSTIYLASSPQTVKLVKNK